MSKNNEADNSLSKIEQVAGIAQELATSKSIFNLLTDDAVIIIKEPVTGQKAVIVPQKFKGELYHVEDNMPPVQVYKSTFVFMLLRDYFENAPSKCYQLLAEIIKEGGAE